MINITVWYYSILRKEEINDHKENLRPFLSNTLQKQITIVFGYSGEADRAFNVIEKEFNSKNGLVWLGHNESPTNYLKLLLEQKYVEYIGGCDFDQTMIAVAQELGVWLAKAIDNSMQHLLEELDEVKIIPSMQMH